MTTKIVPMNGSGSAGMTQHGGTDSKQQGSGNNEQAEHGHTQVEKVKDKEHEATEALDQKEKVQNAVRHLNDYVQDIRRELRFTLSEQSGKTQVSVIEPETNTLIRTISMEDAIEQSEKLKKSGKKEPILINVRA